MKALFTAVSLALFPILLLGQAPTQPNISKGPLTRDEIAIYRTFLFSYDTGLDAPINVADITVKFDPDPGDLKGCLKEFATSNSSAELHRFTTEFSDLAKIRMIDTNTHKIADPGIAIRQGDSVDHAVKAGFEAGVLTLSEIAFDPTHHFAAFTYSFHCGALCGNGGTVILEMQHGIWKISHRQCSMWIS